MNRINKRTFSFTIAISLLMFMNLVSFAQTSFSQYQTYKTGSAPTVVSIGDLNNDSRNDVVLCTGYGMETDTTADNRSFVFIQNKNGTLEKPIRYVNSKFTPYAISISDVNNDRLNDLIIGYDDSVGIFYQNSQGSLSAMKSNYSGHYERIDGIATGDFNNDALTDIAIAYSGSNIVSIMLQKFNGAFDYRIIEFSKIISANLNRVIMSGDINTDKHDDIAIGTDKGVFVLLQNNSGGFAPVKHIPLLTDYIATGLDISDVNNDGLTDIVQTISAPATDSKIVIHYNTGKNIPDSTVISSSLPFAEPVKTGDLNCDSIPEIITANGSMKSICVYEHSKGKIEAYKSYTVNDANHYNPYGMDIGDINNDGKNDIVIADYKNGLITLLNNITANGYCCIKPDKPQQPKGLTGICAKGITTTYRSNNISSDSVLWNIWPVNSGTIISSASDSCVVTWNDSYTGRATISVIVSNNCGYSISQPLIITVGIVPLDLGNDTSICERSKIIIHGTDAYDNYSWNINASTDSLFETSKAGKYVLTAGNVCGTTTDSISVTIYPDVKIDLPTQSVLCKGDTLHFDFTSSLLVQWKWNDGIKTATRLIDKQGIYNLTTTDIHNCKQTKTIKIEESSIPQITIPNDTVACDSFSETLTPGCVDCDLLWNDGSVSASRKISQAGTYSVTASNECGQTSGRFTVEIAKSPILPTFRDTILCEGLSLIYDISTHYPCVYKWQDGKIDSIYNITQAGKYTTTVTDKNGCNNSGSFNVFERMNPTIKLPHDTVVCDSVLLAIDLTCNDCIYLWNDGDTLSQKSITSTGVYSATVTNICGMASDSLLISKQDCNSFVDLPTAFSPNDDTNNDMLIPVGKNISDVVLKVYSRNGTLVYDSSGQIAGWNGQYNNRDADVGIYLYSLSAKSTIDGQRISKQGTVTLIR